MVISIKSIEADTLVRELVEETGESITEAVTQALKERLLKFHHTKNTDLDRAAIRAIAKHYRSLPDFDLRSSDEILGYDEKGLL